MFLPSCNRSYCGALYCALTSVAYHSLAGLLGSAGPLSQLRAAHFLNHTLHSVSCCIFILYNRNKYFNITDAAILTLRGAQI